MLLMLKYQKKDLYSKGGRHNKPSVHVAGHSTHQDTARSHSFVGESTVSSKPYFP